MRRVTVFVEVGAGSQSLSRCCRTRQGLHSCEPFWVTPRAALGQAARRRGAAWCLEQPPRACVSRVELSPPLLCPQLSCTSSCKSASWWTRGCPPCCYSCSPVPCVAARCLLRWRPQQAPPAPPRPLPPRPPALDKPRLSPSRPRRRARRRRRRRRKRVRTTSLVMRVMCSHLSGSTPFIPFL